MIIAGIDMMVRSAMRILRGRVAPATRMSCTLLKSRMRKKEPKMQLETWRTGLDASIIGITW
jgi:hypothetical protein